MAKEILCLVSEGDIDNGLAAEAMKALYEDGDVSEAEYLAFLNEL